MNFKEYQNLAMRTARRGDRDFDLLHAALGVITEGGELVDAYKRHLVYGKELDTLNLVEEVGDVLWYAALACAAAELDMDEFYGKALSNVSRRNDPEGSPLLIASSIATFGSVMLECVLSPNDYDGRAEAIYTGALLATVVDLIGLCRHFKVTLNQVASANISKLMRRYPNGYSDQDALVRNVRAEVAALAQAV